LLHFGGDSGAFWGDFSPKIAHNGSSRIWKLRLFVAEPARKISGQWDVIEPVGKRVVIRKDDNRRETKSGIVLPGNHEIPVLTGRVIAISKQIERDEDFPIKKLDKVLFDPRDAVPVEFESDNRLFVVPLEKVLAIFRKAGGEAEEGE
jgi:chaperonin GroES